MRKAGSLVGQATAPLGSKLRRVAKVRLADRGGFRHYLLSPQKRGDFPERKFQCCPSLRRDPLASEASQSGGPSPLPPVAPATVTGIMQGRHRRAGRWCARPPNSTPENRLLVCPEGSEGGRSCPQFPGVSLCRVGRGLPGAVLPGPAQQWRALLPSLPGMCAGGRTPGQGPAAGGPAPPLTTATSVPKPAGSWVSSG